MAVGGRCPNSTDAPTYWTPESDGWSSACELWPGTHRTFGAGSCSGGRAQLEDENEPGKQFVDDFIYDFGVRVHDKETFALRWTPGAQKVYNFPPPGAGGVSGFLSKYS